MKNLLSFSSIFFLGTWLAPQPVTATLSKSCSLPLSPGPCRAKVPRFFYDSSAGRCKLFFYTGCGANENNFHSMADCHESCGGGESALKHLKGTHCLLPHTDNNGIACRGAFPKFTFNSRSLSCERILYGGCGGTQNLYSSWEECTSSCLHQSATPNMMASRGNVGGASSQRVLFAGFSNATSLCELPPVAPGNVACKAYMKKWTYDARQSKCVEYVYGGCRGTANLFDTEEACMEKCPEKQPTDTPTEEAPAPSRPALCSLPTLKEGRRFACRAYMPRWTFSEADGECKSFIYGGCGASENVFLTKEDCMKTCDEGKWAAREAKTLDVCTMPVVTGMCRAMMPKYAYDQEKRRCQLFTYGGCGGNGNRFDTVEECVNTCGGEEPSAETLCSKIRCDPKEALLYKAKGCTPILKPGECCPSQWDCSAWEERLGRKGECFLASKEYPTGKYYAVGDMIGEAKDVCEVGCFCSRAGDAGARIVCAVMDCAMPPPVLQTGDGKRSKPCKRIYSDVHDCCPSDFRCEDDEEESPTAPTFQCSFNNQTVEEGETFYPESDNPCRRCLCGEGWDGERADELCHDQHCFAQADERMQRGCQPIYHPRGCCPINWVCPPKEQPKIVKPEPIEESIPLVEEPLDVGSILIRITQVDSSSQESDVCLLPQPESNDADTEIVTRFFFDMDDRKCKSFEFSGDDSTAGNKFESVAECAKTCKEYIVKTSLTGPIDCEDASEENAEPAKSDRCLPSRRFRFNKAEGRCQDFVQYGCAGNRNSFQSLDECEVRCAPKKIESEEEEEDVETEEFEGKSSECNLPVEPGMCRARIKRFFFDKKSGICKQFWYGGCNANENNFIDEKSCIAKCVPKEKIARALEGQTLDLNVEDRCSQKVETGPCRAKAPKFFFDPVSSTCKMFFYGGCGGNDNRFDFLAECMGACPADPEVAAKATQKCAQPAVVGNCRATIPRWYYDQTKGRCQRFLYSGCDANENNFESAEECLLECTLMLAQEKNAGKVQQLEDKYPQDSSVCLLDKSSGVCKARFRRFYFNKETKACEPFYFSGCQANANNFKTPDDCISRCSKLMEGAAAAPSAPVSAAKQADAVRNPSCFLSPEVGPCRARRPMWYYDSQSRRCQRFFWGGCKGNENRFRSEAECAETCEDAEQEEFESEQKKVQRLPEEFSQEALENHILSRPAEPKCHMGSESYSRGDIVRFPHEQCKVCVCATPPSLTCGIAPCPAIAFIPQPGKMCSPVKDKHGCCQVGLKCVDPPKPEKKDVCASRPCPALGFIPQAGKTCHPKMDEDGCCQIGLSCYSTEPLSREEVCAYRPCPAIGFPNKPGHVCEPVMDDDGCCQVGVTCLSTSPPEVKENPCAGRPCPAMAFLPQEGKVCTPEMDADGCCQVGLSCKEERSEEDASVPDPCFRRPCPLIAFLPQPGKTCTEVKDADGCCQVGLKCV